MRYYVVSSDDDKRERWETTLDQRGFDVVDEYDSDAVVVTLGGDGTILYAARAVPEPTILPVRTEGSRGYKTHLDEERLVAALEAIETGDEGEACERIVHRKIAAYRDGTQVLGEFDALNEVGVHHRSPTMAAVLSVEIRDGDRRETFERVVGDGVLVATPFGSTAYYRSITGGSFREGLGVAFNNVYAPVDAPTYRLASSDATIEVELLDSEHASGAVLTRDNAEETADLAVGEPIEIRQTAETVELLAPVDQ